MGGDYYDRQVISAKERLFGNENVGLQDCLDCVLDPRERKIKIQTSALNPIVLGLDVTGSMGDWSKIIYDKLPMFYGQIMMNKYLQDPALSFCGIGDATSDSAPLQVTPFERGKQLDAMLQKIWIEKGGGGTDQESYELAAFFYNRYVSMPRKLKAYFFIIGDQDYYADLNPKIYERILGGGIKQRINGFKQFCILKQNYQVFLLRKTYVQNDQKIHKHWCQTLGKERVLTVNSPKGCVDVILGVIAMTSQSRNLQDYIYDMEQRGQSEQRIKQVKDILSPYYQYLLLKGRFNNYQPRIREEKPIVQNKQIDTFKSIDKDTINMIEEIPQNLQKLQKQQQIQEQQKPQEIQESQKLKKSQDLQQSQELLQSQQQQKSQQLSNSNQVQNVLPMIQQAQNKQQNQQTKLQNNETTGNIVVHSTQQNTQLKQQANIVPQSNIPNPVSDSNIINSISNQNIINPISNTNTILIEEEKKKQNQQ